MTLTPAYGRTYKTQADVLRDFNNNLDFLCHTPECHGRAINKEQIGVGIHVQFRYGKQNEKVLGHVVQGYTKADHKVAIRNYAD